MLVDLKNVWEQQGDQLYEACARAIMGFVAKADADGHSPAIPVILKAAGAALVDVSGGEEPDEIEVSTEAAGLDQDLSELITNLASLTDFGVQEIGRLFDGISNHAALKHRDVTSLAYHIKNMDLRSYADMQAGY